MFRSRITQAPIPFDPAAGADAVAALAPPPEVAPLIAGAAGCSPFLAMGMAREREWLAGLWDAAPEDILDGLLAETARIDGDPKPSLRVLKRRIGLLVSLCDLGGVWLVMEATAALTRFADAATDAALADALGRHAKGPVEGDGSLVAIAMGKMGAFELNYSSDIDLVLLFDESRYDPSDYGTARAILLKAARTAMATLSDVTAEGYVFRTDLRLRPDPGSTPIVLSMEAAERYYEAMGRAWERAAWIKARACAGAVEAGEGFVARLAPFVWRRHLDFAAVQDAHDMRLRIRDHKGLGGPLDLAGHHIKLGRGGIREIEFYAQTQQIIAGGRDRSLRVRPTLEALDRLVEAGWLGAETRDVLAPNYVHLRRVEHALQMVQDAQTHVMPRDADGLRRIANLLGEGEADAFLADLRDRIGAVERIVDPSFKPDAPAPDAPDAIEGAAAVTDRWPTYPALRSERARTIFARLRPRLLRELGGAARPAEALSAFDDFLRGLPAGVQIFSLFEAKDELVSLIADICATAPDLARYLSRNADVLDAVIDGRFFADLPERWEPPAPDDDYEATLIALRRWHRERHFRIGVHLLRRLAPPETASRRYAALADATLAGAWAAAEAETARRYGRVPGLALAGIGMGSLGAGRLNARSDLDLVVLHDGGEGVSDGARALPPAQWAARFTQTLITALSAPMGDGRLYEVDMRLRPSGRQGPVATALSGFRTYQANEAWVWEHMALTQARPLAGSPEVGAAAMAARAEVLASSRFAPDEILRGLAEMRARVRAAERVGGGLSVKVGAGRLQDIALVAQAHMLIAAASGGEIARTVDAQLATDGWLPPEACATLAETHARLSDVQQMLRLITADDPPGDLGTGGLSLLAAITGSDDVAASCDVAAGRAEAAIDAALDRAGLSG
ncbi:glutamine-synthetase adenylyltransferase [Jannaschia sp. KMU-145]|uniref:[protein-PII] uridylyltransferase family protein n=1 Tax=Jannaschia halovivens TaxID=3388667 RepID=UPI00396B1FD0